VNGSASATENAMKCDPRAKTHTRRNISSMDLENVSTAAQKTYLYMKSISYQKLYVFTFVRSKKER
jgi:hypothetical protein